jgi:hypothetical protein
LSEPKQALLVHKSIAERRGSLHWMRKSGQGQWVPIGEDERLGGREDGRTIVTYVVWYVDFRRQGDLPTGRADVAPVADDAGR